MCNQLKYRLVFLCLILVFTLTNSMTVDAQLTNFDCVAENEYLKLYIDPVTTEVAVEDIATGKLWFTNPQGRHDQRGLAFERLSSQFTLIHDPNQVEKENYRFSTIYEQFEVSPIESGVRVDYEIVERWEADHYLPRMIGKERMEQLILANIEDDGDRATFLDAYNLIMLVPLGDDQRPEIAGLLQDKVFGDYELVVLNPDFQEREAQVNALKLEAAVLAEDSSERQSIQDQISQLERQLRREKEEIIWRLMYTKVDHRLVRDKTDDIIHDDVAHLIYNPTYLMAQVPRFTLTSLQKIIVETDYNPIDCAEDHELNSLDPLNANMQTFSIPIEYRLDGPNLLVRIPAKEIVYPIDVEDALGEKYTFPLLSIRLLEYFGAASTDSEGYIFVPDGSGALINLNNGRLAASAYNEQVYGTDFARETIQETRRFPETIRLPVFGLKQDDQAIFAIIEEGASLARIRADISGRINNYNRVFAEFSPMARGSVSIDLETDNIDFSGSMSTYQPRMYEGDFVIRYCFLSGADANYVGMANTYRDYLIENYQLEPLDKVEDVPFYLEVIGAIDKREPILGIARNVVRSLTTFAETQEILEELSDQGIANIKVKYSGLLKGGVNHHYPSKAMVEASLGGKNALQDLNDYIVQNGWELYPSVGFLNVYNDTIFDGFSSRKDSSRLLNRLVARKYEYRLDMFDMINRRSSYVLSPRALGSLVDDFLDSYQNLNIANISLFDLAREVNSDFIDDVTFMVDREQSVDAIVEQFEKMKELQIMLDHGNAYAIPYADSIVNLPARGSAYNIVDDEIPFYQILVHGYVNYASNPLNLSSSITSDYLRMLETGGYPYFMVSHEDSFEVKATDYNHLYALHYGDWLDLAASVYASANAALSEVAHLKIIDHQRLMDNVYQTTYENGTVIIVNYNKQSVYVNGQVINGEDFIVLGGTCQ